MPRGHEHINFFLVCILECFSGHFFLKVFLE